MSEMVKIRDVGSGVTVAELVEPRLDITNSDAFKSAMTDLAVGSAHRIVMDFAHVEFVDSSGLGVLVSVAKTLQRKNATVFLCGIGEQVGRIFKMTRMESLFNICLTADEAISRLKAGSTGA